MRGGSRLLTTEEKEQLKNSRIWREKLLSHIRETEGPRRNAQREMRLEKSLGPRNRRRSILYPDVSEKHADAAERTLFSRIRTSPDLPDIDKHESTARRRLQCMTVLFALADLDAAGLQDAIAGLRQWLNRLYADESVNWILGAVELEIVDLPLMRRLIRSDADTTKPHVLGRLPTVNSGNGIGDRQCLIHFHGVIDVAEGKIDHVRGLMSKPGTLDILDEGTIISELKGFSKTWDKKKKSLRKNLSHWIRYPFKGGNDGLRINHRWGRDRSDVESAMARSAKARREDPDRDFDLDERSLTYAEIVWLNDAYYWLSQGKADGRGETILMNRVDYIFPASGSKFKSVIRGGSRMHLGSTKLPRTRSFYRQRELLSPKTPGGFRRRS